MDMPAPHLVFPLGGVFRSSYASSQSCKGKPGPESFHWFSLGWSPDVLKFVFLLPVSHLQPSGHHMYTSYLQDTHTFYPWWCAWEAGHRYEGGTQSIEGVPMHQLGHSMSEASQAAYRQAS